MKLAKSKTPTCLGTVKKIEGTYYMVFPIDAKLNSEFEGLRDPLNKRTLVAKIEGIIYVPTRIISNIWKQDPFFIEGQEFDSLDLGGPGDEEFVLLCWKD